MTDAELIAEANARAGDTFVYMKDLSLIARLTDALVAHQWPLGGKRCDECDNGVMPQWAFCVYCGHPLDAAPTPPEAKP